jgi:hypothetical protein
MIDIKEIIRSSMDESDIKIIKGQLDENLLDEVAEEDIIDEEERVTTPMSTPISVVDSIKRRNKIFKISIFIAASVYAALYIKDDQEVKYQSRSSGRQTVDIPLKKAEEMNIFRVIDCSIKYPSKAGYEISCDNIDISPKPVLAFTGKFDKKTKTAPANVFLSMKKDRYDCDMQVPKLKLDKKAKREVKLRCKMRNK